MYLVFPALLQYSVVAPRLNRSSAMLQNRERESIICCATYIHLAVINTPITVVQTTGAHAVMHFDFSNNYWYT